MFRTPGGHKGRPYDAPPRRVVSLVPSVTESLFDLGLGSAVVGVTEYCVHPADKTAPLPKIGGTKSVRIETIRTLRPDLVIANQEENTREIVEKLEEAGIPVWLTFPRTVDGAINLLYEITELFRSPVALQAVRSLAGSVDYARLAAADLVPERTFCPIWFDRTGDGTPWWMTINADTFTHDLLALFGKANVFADRERSYPLAADPETNPKGLSQGPRHPKGPRHLKGPQDLRGLLPPVTPATPVSPPKRSRPQPRSWSSCRPSRTRLARPTPLCCGKSWGTAPGSSSATAAC